MSGKKYTLVAAVLFFVFTSARAQNWQIQVVDSMGNVGGYLSLVLDGQDLPHISYFDATHGNLKYARWDGSAWVIQSADTDGVVGHYTSIAVDKSNFPHISYFDSTNGHLKYAKWTGSAWQVAIVDVGGVGQYSSIAVNKTNTPHISYYDQARHRLKYARPVQSAWQRIVIDSVGSAGVGTSITLDTTDIPHIAYFDSQFHRLRYAKSVGSGWDLKSVDTLAGRYPSIIMKGGSYPYISYYDDVNGDLKYARWTGTNWRKDVIDATGVVGLWTSQSMNGPVYLSYFDSTAGDLKCANTRDFIAWEINRVDTVGTVGAYSGLKMSRLHYPSVAYYDATNGNLKYAQLLVSDVAPTAVTTPDTVVRPGQDYIPRAWVTNFGNTTVSFSVYCNIYSVGIPIYRDSTKVDTLIAGDSLRCQFNTWTVPAVDSTDYTVEVYTKLDGDDFPANDTIWKDLFAVTKGAEEDPNRFAVAVRLSVRNPVSSGEPIEYSVPGIGRSMVTLEIVDPAGRRVSTLVNSIQETGVRSVACPVLNPGVYFVSLEVGSRTVIGKLVVIE